MTDRLPLNLHLVANGAAYLPVFADLVVEPVSPAQWGDKAACRQEFETRQAATAALKAELIAQGADERAAAVAAGSFMTFGFAPDYGLGDMHDGLLAGRARVALNAWVRARIEARNAAHGAGQAAA